MKKILFMLLLVQVVSFGQRPKDLTIPKTMENRGKILTTDGDKLDKLVLKVNQNLVVDNISQLRASSGDNGDKCTVLGYYTKGDGGGGEFYWDDTNTVSDNNGTIIQVAGKTKGRWVRNFNNDVSVKWFGAKGDGVTNDTDAFQSMSTYVNKLGSCNIIIPKSIGEYIVCKQIRGTDKFYDFTGNIIDLVNIENCIITFNGNIKVENGLAFGSFDPITGIVYNAAVGGFTKINYAATVGTILKLTNCKNMVINNPNFNGNSQNYLIGGYWGDVGIQLDACGVKLFSCENVVVNNPIMKYFGLDGFYITGENEQNMNITVNNLRSLYNGRQGISVTGGNNITLNSPELAYNGRGRISSSPNAGIDIESNGNQIRGIFITNINAHHNKGNAVLVLNPSVTNDIIINGGTLHGDINEALWDICGAVLNDCKIIGGIDNAQGTKFNRCLFSDKMYSIYTPTFNGKIFRNGSNSTIIKDSEFEIVNSSTSELYINNDATVINSTYYIRLTNPKKNLRVGVVRPILGDNFNIVEDYRFTEGNTGVNINGNRTYIDTAGTNQDKNWKNGSKLTGNNNISWNATNITDIVIPLK